MMAMMGDEPRGERKERGTCDIYMKEDVFFLWKRKMHSFTCILNILFLFFFLSCMYSHCYCCGGTGKRGNDMHLNRNKKRRCMPSDEKYRHANCLFILLNPFLFFLVRSGGHTLSLSPSLCRSICLPKKKIGSILDIYSLIFCFLLL